MKTTTTNRIPATGLTTTPEDRMATFLAAVGAKPLFTPSSIGGFVGDKDTDRHEGGRPGAKNNKPPRGERAIQAQV